MGSVPTQTFKADLNGTGTLVDITTYVANNRYEHRYGRADWTSATQPPGQLTVTLENLDGRFTPGSTATYARGVVRNMVVEWTCGSRVRRFYVTTSDLAFPDGVAGVSMVTLRCRDALGLLAERPMEEMVREATLAGNPVAYWPLDESPAAGVVFRDISGNGQPGLQPFTLETDADYLWDVESGYIDSGGVGPRTDGVGAPRLNTQDGVAPIPLFQTTTPFSHRGGLRNNRNRADAKYTPSLNRNIVIPDRTAPYLWGGAPPAPYTVTYPMSGWLNTSAGSYDYVVSFWFSVDNVYGGTSTTANPTDGPYVVLAEVALEGGDIGGFLILWRIPDRKLLISTPFNTVQLSSTSYSVKTGSVHHLALVVQHRENVYFGGSYVPIDARIKGYLDGIDLAAGSVNLSAPAYPIGLTLGTNAALSNPMVSGLNPTMYALTGTVSNASIHPPSEITGVGVWTRYSEVWQAGTTGPAEKADARFSRVGAWAQRRLPATLAWSPQGTPQAGKLGPHKTGGKDALTVLCETLASEEASLTTVYTGGVDTVRAWLDSTQRSLTPALTIDAQDDASDTPELGFDLSGVVATAEAKGFNQSVAFSDTVAAAQWQGRAATVNCPMLSEVDLLALAQYRTVKGRAGQISPTRITINAAGSKANVTTALLALYPGATIRITGLPSSKIGYSTIDCTLVGVSERHGLGVNAFELTLIPDQIEAYVDPGLGTEGPWRLIDEPDWVGNPRTGRPASLGWTGVFMLLAGNTTGGTLSAVATTGYIISNTAAGAAVGPAFGAIPSTLMSTDAADYPLSIRVDSEIITLPNAPGAPAPTTINSTQCLVQTVTGMQRGQMGTTATTHAGGGLVSVSEDQGLTVVTDSLNVPLLAF